MTWRLNKKWSCSEVHPLQTVPSSPAGRRTGQGSYLSHVAAHEQKSSWSTGYKSKMMISQPNGHFSHYSLLGFDSLLGRALAILGNDVITHNFTWLFMVVHEVDLILIRSQLELSIINVSIVHLLPGLKKNTTPPHVAGLRA